MASLLFIVKLEYHETKIINRTKFTLLINHNLIIINHNMHNRDLLKEGFPVII